MNELSRMRYLDALGIPNYVSRRQLPGAAPTRRLVISHSVGGETDPAPPPAQAASASPIVPTLGEVAPRPRPAAPQPAVPQPAAPQPARAKAANQADVVRFSLAAIFVGQIAWVEQLEGNPLAREQVQLVHAMARAVSGDVEGPDVTQFDWPMHQNHQLDLGPEAARAGVAGFLQRQLEQRKCRGLVLLGEAAEMRVPVGQLGQVNVVVTESTLAMLQEPARKRQVWQDLQPLVLRV